MSGTASYNAPDADYNLSGYHEYNAATGQGKVLLSPSGTATLTLTPINDTRYEVPETAILTVPTPPPGHTLGTSSATITIDDDDPQPRTVDVTATGDDAVAHEGGGERGRYTFTLAGGSLSSPLTLQYRIRNPNPPERGVVNDDDYSLPGSAVAGSGEHAGYTLRPITFEAGQTVVTVDLTPFGDSRIEGDETATAEVVPQAGSGTMYGSPGVAAGTAAAITIKDMPVVNSVTWTGVDPGDGANLTQDNPDDLGGGFRLFPDKNTPAGPVHDKANAEVKLDRAVAAGEAVTIYFKLFDVDDPTAFGGPLDPIDATGDPLTGAPAISFNGNDNREEALPPVRAVAVGPGHDTAWVEFTFPGKRAGNNYRVFATTDPNLVHAVELNYDVKNGLSGTNPFRRTSDRTVTDPKQASKTLTIWRRLYLEVDKMQAGTVAQNRYDGREVSAVTHDPATGVTTLELPRPADADFHGNQHFRGGLISVLNLGLHTVHKSVDNGPTLNTIDVTIVDANKQVHDGAVGKQFYLYDDDMGKVNTDEAAFDFKATLDDPNTSKLTAALKPAFFEPKFDFNTSDTLITFDRNLNPDDPLGDEMVKTMKADRQYGTELISDAYITAHLVSAFQGARTHDGDPSPADNPNVPPERRLGGTLAGEGGVWYMASLIYKETLRDAGGTAEHEAYTVVHEIGHLFERRDASEDFHLHTGVMAPGFAPGEPQYAPETLERIRSRNFASP